MVTAGLRVSVVRLRQPDAASLAPPGATIKRQYTRTPIFTSAKIPRRGETAESALETPNRSAQIECGDLIEERARGRRRTRRNREAEAPHGLGQQRPHRDTR